MTYVDFENVFILTQKELRDARRNRWFLLYAIAFAGLSLALAWLALSGAGNYGLAGFGRTSASLINLVLLIVPLMGLTLGALSLAGEREKGTLLYLLAQPINQLELLLGKFTGHGPGPDRCAGPGLWPDRAADRRQRRRGADGHLCRAAAALLPAGRGQPQRWAF